MIFKELNFPLEVIGVFEHFQEFPYSFLLDSANSCHEFGRYSFFGFSPFLLFKSKDKKIEIISLQGRTIYRGNPWKILETLFSRYQDNSLDKSLPFPFPGGIVGYFSYDLGRYLEKLPNYTVDDLNLPECYLGFYDSVFIFDHWEKKSWISSAGLGEKNKKLRKQYAENQLKKIEKKIFPLLEKKNNKDINENFEERNSLSQNLEFVSNFTYSDYLKAIKKAKKYIAQGDIYQVNLSQRFSTPLFENAWAVYKYLRKINPAPFAAYLNFPEVKIVSASPERFLRIDRQNVQTRPIKGTRPRGKNSIEDEMLARELLRSEKDRAELVMIVDLERNDLGRVCEYGTVKVPKLITLEKHPTVYHLVGTVEGILRKDKTHLDCLKACFPGGSISGAPKIRAMEIIEELEPTKRNIYTGAIGYLGFNGQSDLNIVIRTLLFTNGKIYFQVGGGIVTDSEPEKEYQETLDKAKALFSCLSPAKEELNRSGTSRHFPHSIIL